jgi:hypothetical protein
VFHNGQGTTGVGTPQLELHPDGAEGPAAAFAGAYHGQAWRFLNGHPIVLSQGGTGTGARGCARLAASGGAERGHQEPEPFEVTQGRWIGVQPVQELQVLFPERSKRELVVHPLSLGSDQWPFHGQHVAVPSTRLDADDDPRTGAYRDLDRLPNRLADRGARSASVDGGGASGRCEAQFQALRRFALDGTDHTSHQQAVREGSDQRLIGGSPSARFTAP